MANEFKHKDPGTELTQAEFIASDGTGHIFDSQAQGDILYATSTTELARLGKDTNDSRVLTNTGTNDNPAWAQVTLTTGVTGTLPAGNGGTGITSLGTNVATFLGTPSSANLRSALTDETGTGEAVFADTPTLVTPALGTPGSGTLTNCTGLPTAGLVNNAVTLAKMDGITRGSIIYGNASGDPTALAKGTETYVLTAGADDIAWAVAGSGAVSYEGGQTSEVTTTSTSATDLLSATSLTIAALSPFLFFVNGRKTTGAGDDAGLGIKQNSTVIGEAQPDTTRPWATSTHNEAQDGGGIVWGLPRATNYTHSMQGVTVNNASDAHTSRNANPTNNMNITADNVAVEITSLVIRGITDNASQTVAADELQVYEFATS